MIRTTVLWRDKEGAAWSGVFYAISELDVEKHLTLRGYKDIKCVALQTENLFGLEISRCTPYECNKYQYEQRLKG